MRSTRIIVWLSLVLGLILSLVLKAGPANADHEPVPMARIVTPANGQVFYDLFDGNAVVDLSNAGATEYGNEFYVFLLVPDEHAAPGYVMYGLPSIYGDGSSTPVTMEPITTTGTYGLRVDPKFMGSASTVTSWFTVTPKPAPVPESPSPSTQPEPVPTTEPTPEVIPTVEPMPVAVTTTVTPVAETAPVYPACRRVWKDGKRLPKAYRGCEKRSGVTLPVWIKCESGKRFTTYKDKFWAVAGKRIDKGGTNKYSKAYWKCVG